MAGAELSSEHGGVFQSDQAPDQFVALMGDRYKKSCDLFRGDTLTTLAKWSALDGNDGWAVYHVPHDDQPEYPREITESEQLDAGFREVLIMSVQKKLGYEDGMLPHIRILTNEMVVTPLGHEWLVTDMGLDIDNDSIYLVDSVNLEPEAEQTPDDDEEASTGRKPKSTYAARFYITEEMDLLINKNFCLQLPPIMSINDTIDEKDVEALPFGHYADLDDKIHALEVGQSILRSVMAETPVYALYLPPSTN